MRSKYYNMTLIYHTIGAFDTNTREKIQEIYPSILKDGLKSKAQLIKEGLIDPLPVKGIFSDEHKNIYFWATLDNINLQYKNIVAINVDPSEVYVFNSQLRGAVAYFEYEASKMTLKEYLEKKEKYDQLEESISNSTEQYRVIEHSLTAEPIIIQSARSNNKNFGFMYDGYSAEVLIPASNIPSSYFSLYTKINNENDTTRELISQNNTLIYNAPKSGVRGIFLNDDGSESYIPSRDRIEGDFGKIVLTQGAYHPAFAHSLRYGCDESPKEYYASTRFLKVESHGNWDAIVVKGDDKSNSVYLSPSTETRIFIGKEGADKLFVDQTDWPTIFVDFTPSEGDKIAFPSYLYPSTADIISNITYKNGMAIIPTSDLGSLILPNISEGTLVESDFFLFTNIV